MFDLMLLFAGHATLADQRAVMRIIGLRTKTGSLARMNSHISSVLLVAASP